MDLLEKERYIFGAIFFLSNKLQTILDRAFAADGITTKQLFMTLVIQQFGDVSPTINDVARVMGTSHQNVKQIAMKLEKKGLVTIERDSEDRRAMRIVLTEMSQSFWKDRVEEGKEFLEKFFATFEKGEIDSLFSSLRKLSKGIEVLNTWKMEEER